MRASLRLKANKAKKNRCKNLIAVLENPKSFENIGSTIRNVNAFGVEKLYIIDERDIIKQNWSEMRENRRLLNVSASAIKWTFVKIFKTTKECIDYLKKKGFVSLVTSPHIKDKINFELHNGRYTDKKMAVWFGNESEGISDEAVKNSTACINLKMCGIIESLNLGTCTGIVLYEVTRQRTKFVENKNQENVIFTQINRF